MKNSILGLLVCCSFSSCLAQAPPILLHVDLSDAPRHLIHAHLQIPVGAGYQVNHSETIRREAGIPTAAVGMITEPAQADQIVRTGQADLVLLARELLRNPYWPLHAAEVLRKEIAWPVQYVRARRSH